MDMELSVGARLGPYEILAAIGAGGMGEVYRARDARLTRDVALKILPADFAQDASRRSRFEREARSVASLNHPNIVALYDIGSQDGTAYMVTELVDGESLRGIHLPLRKMLDAAAQIADGLAAAHAAGVTHRDLKPDNVMLSRDGRIKILDFGIAKVAGTPADDATTQNSTAVGMIVGTAGYMAPEQVRGTAVDHRADIFAFGSLLYELITGSRAFAADSAADTMAAILKNDPPELPPDVPAGLRQIVYRCLEKKPEERFQSAQDLAFALRHLAGTSATLPAIAEPQPTAKRSYSWIGVAGFIVGIVLAGFLAMRWEAAQDAEIDRIRLMRFSSDRLDEREPVFSPDGRSIAYLRTGSGVSDLLVKGADAPAPIAIIHSQSGIRNPVWSPDGKRICYEVRPALDLMCVGAAGGTPQRLMPNAVTPRFTPDGTALYFVRVDGKVPWLFRSSPPGNKPEKVAAGNLTQDLRLLSPISPDSHELIATMRSEQRWLISLPDLSHRVLSGPDSGVRTRAIGWFPDSRHFVSAEETADLVGSRIVIEDTQSNAQRLVIHGADQITDLDVRADGKQFVYSGGPVERDIVEYSSGGKFVRGVATSSMLEGFPAWAPAGDRFVYAVGGPGQVDSLWIGSDSNVPATFVQNLTSHATRQSRISPDGGRIAYADPAGIRIVSTSGGRPIEALSTTRAASVCWSADGEWIWFSEGPNHLAKLPIGGGAPQPVQAIAGNLADCSPDGRWLLRVGQADVLLTSTSGAPERKIAHLEDYPGLSDNSLQFGEGGKIVYLLCRDQRSIDVLDTVSGKKIRTISFEIPQEDQIESFSVNPDGTRVLLNTGGDRNDVWVAEDFPHPATSWLRWFRHWELPNRNQGQ
jgi:Tol biopolymer transport system component